MNIIKTLQKQTDSKINTTKDYYTCVSSNFIVNRRLAEINNRKKDVL